jgi:hypothetical protein
MFRRLHRTPSGWSSWCGGLEDFPHLARLHERALLPWLDHHDGTGGVVADHRGRPAQEDIEKAAFAMRALYRARGKQSKGAKAAGTFLRVSLI